MKEFWNARYSEKEFAYGKEPNVFFKEQLNRISPGKLLLPAEGEGRNAVYAAKNGWQVTAFDSSEAGKEKAVQLAAEYGVDINYIVQGFDSIDFPFEYFDAIALIYAHFPKEFRREWHQKVQRWLKPGGTLILEAFSKDHLKFNSVNEKAGGPKDIELLFSTSLLGEDFGEIAPELLEEVEVELQEGNYHVGKSSVVRMVGQKKLP